ncbi:hypothetical protein V5F77_03600 [Xanthobacter sp. DSM 24535]|uniref:hypothetical protein n=1 Tax=Roseixanthobacter psychrophilus TaxID=3119917 RepID=UPI00372BA2EB
MPETLAAWASALEFSALGAAARSTMWLYPLANLVHIFGAALVVGAIATFDVQILRRAPGAGLVVRAAIPVAAVGLALQAVSGMVLVSAETTTVIRNPAFLAKMALLVLALANVALFHARFGTALRAGAGLERARGTAMVSLASWTLVLLAGRAIAYV